MNHSEKTYQNTAHLFLELPYTKCQVWIFCTHRTCRDITVSSNVLGAVKEIYKRTTMLCQRTSNK